MPNWCENTTYVDGPTADINILIGLISHGENIQLINLIPMPDILTGTTSPAPTKHPGDFGVVNASYHPDTMRQAIEEWERAEAAEAETGHRDWYSWQLANWGVKWGDCRTQLVSHVENKLQDSYTSHITLKYDTPWAPFDHQFWEKVSRLIPKLRFVTASHEPGMGFAGVTAAHNGEVYFDESWSTDDYMPESSSDDDEAEDIMGAYYERVQQALDVFIEEAMEALNV